MGSPKPDHHPEYVDYEDKGCELASACTRCPLPKCRYEGHVKVSTILRIQRENEIKRLADEGVSVAEISNRLGISKRTVTKVKKVLRDGGLLS